MQRVESFSATHVSPHERLSFWNDVAKITVGPVVVEPLHPETFTASISRLRLTDMDIIVPESGPARVQNVHRTPESSFLNLQIQQTGRSWHSTCGHEHVLEAGDF